jgi:hypothetical protein
MTKSWRIEYRDSGGGGDRGSVTLAAPPGLVKTKAETELDSVSITLQHEKEVAAKNKHCMALATGPGKSLLQTAFMLWMSGTSIQIFSIYTTGNALVNPLKGIASINQVFGKFDNEEGVDTRLPKLIFLSLQLLAVGVALYKCATMNLLPLTSADWLWRLPERQYEENGGVPVP